MFFKLYKWYQMAQRITYSGVLMFSNLNYVLEAYFRNKIETLAFLKTQCKQLGLSLTKLQADYSGSVKRLINFLSC